MWLDRTWWGHIKAKIEVVKDLRYRGAHLTPRSSVTSTTVDKRWETTMQQLWKLRFCPAIVEAKAEAILAKVYAAAFYDIEAAEVRVAKIAKSHCSHHRCVQVQERQSQCGLVLLSVSWG